jgi:hypothetical protein
MNKPLVRQLDSDGATRITEFSVGSIACQSMSYFPHMTKQSELRMLLALKGRFALEGIEGGVLDLPIASRAFEAASPSWSGTGQTQQTLEGKLARDALTEFKSRSLLIPNPRIEFFYSYKKDLDELLTVGYSEIEEVDDYLSEYNMRLDGDSEKSQSHSQKIRRAVHHELFFSDDEARLRRRDSMLAKIMKMENALGFPFAVPACPVIDAHAYQQTAGEDINDKCQATAYSLGMPCATYFIYTKKALKSPEIMDKFFEYVIKGKERYRLIIVNFHELDLHSPPDIRARTSFKNVTKRIRELKQLHDGWEFMLMGAGNQAFIALESFDFVSTSFTGIDKIITWSEGRKLGYWYNERLMLPIPPEDRGIIDRRHCPSCEVVTDEDFTSQRRLSVRRKEHRIHEMDKRSREYRQAVGSKSVGVYIRQALMVSEFSGFQMMIHSV